MRSEPRHPDPGPLHPQLLAALERVRAQRAFSAPRALRAKRERIRSYWERHSLTTGVVALSGGVDSAVVAGLVCDALGPEECVCVTLPEDRSTTGQDDSVRLAGEVCETLGVELVCASITPAAEALRSEIERAIGARGEGWARGQLASYARTPALYYVTSLLTEAGRAAVVCGTTNRDEGDYLGYFGKASDGMVDVQLIADLHKSEVWELARELGIPAEVCEREPVGDMWDGRSDVEVFGASYDFVELYLGWLERDAPSRQDLAEGWGAEAWDQFELAKANLERLHAHNAHKYLGGSPAVHLNVMPSGAPGGWG